MNNNGSNNIKLWNEHFPQLATANDKAITRMIEKSRTLEIPTDFQISAPGVKCNDYVLILNGSVRVQMVTEKGREIMLYYVNKGESCILTTSCLLGGTAFPAESYAAQDTQALALPAIEFDLAISTSANFRKFVFTSFAQRLASVIARIEELCSPSIDRNLAAALLRLTKENTQSIITTHQELASELGTAREVVSRHLKHFEEKGYINLGRGTIQINLLEMLVNISRE